MENADSKPKHKDASYYSTKRLRKDVLEELREQGKFSDFLFVAWGIIETSANDCILRAYGLSTQNPLHKGLVNLSIRRKLEILRDYGWLPLDVYKSVASFEEMRNHLFHTRGIFILHLTETEKNRIMDIGIRAADIMQDLSASKHSNLFREIP